MHGSTSLPHGTVKIVIDGNLLRGVISDSWETSVVSWSGSIGARRLARTRASSPVRCLTSRGRDQPSA